MPGAALLAWMRVSSPLADPFSDPDELFDVYDASGQPTGRVKRRADVHHDGDWHRSFHCHVVLEPTEGTGEAALLLQRRGPYKDTWPGRLDVAVGGHFRSGETLHDVIREMEEEIGRLAQLEDLVRLGRRVYVGELQPGIVDRELQDIYLWRTALHLDEFRPQPVEVTALEAAPIAALLELFAGRAASAPSRRRYPDGQTEPAVIRRDDFIPTLDAYFYRAAVAADLITRGYPHAVV